MKIQHEHFSGYILAGGKSSRMGRDKAFLEINGKTFLQNAVNILTPVCENRIKVVLNKEQNHFTGKLPEGLPYIFDIYEKRGPLGGIHVGLKDCKTKFVFVLAVDLPFVSGKTILSLASAMLEEKADVVIPKHKNGAFEQLSVVFKVESALPTIERLLLENDSISVLKFIESLETIRHFKLDDVSREFDNVNKPEDFSRISSR